MGDAKHDWHCINGNVVEIDVEAIALVRPEAVGRNVVVELPCAAVHVKVCYEDISGDQHFECRVPKANTVHPTFIKVENGLHAILVQAFFVFKVMWIIVEPLANAVHECFVFSNCPDDIAVE